MNINLNSIFPYTRTSTNSENAPPSPAQPEQPTQQRKKITSIAIIAFGYLVICYAMIRSCGRNFNGTIPESPGPSGFSFGASLQPSSKTNLTVQSELWHTLKNTSDLYPDSSLEEKFALLTANSTSEQSIGRLLDQSGRLPIKPSSRPASHLSDHPTSWPSSRPGDRPNRILGQLPTALPSMVASSARIGSNAATMLNRNLRSESVASVDSGKSLTLNLGELTPAEGVSLNTDLHAQTVVKNAGDVNGDGFDDVIIGATTEHRAYVIYGNRTLPSAIHLANLMLMPEQGFTIKGGGVFFGYSVSSAGDVNRDGFDDVIIGAPGANNNAGISYVIYGNRTLPSLIDLAKLMPEQGFSIIGEGSSFSGESVSGAGDFNGDGFDDVIIGAPWANGYTGISYVIYGTRTLPSAINLANLAISKQGFSIIGSIKGDQSGYSVSGIGHFNKDSFDDVIIGAPYAKDQAGMSYIIFGSQFPSTISLGSLKPEQGYSIFGDTGQSGYSVSSAGDFNGDELNDVIIGAPYANYDAGVSYIIYGSEITPFPGIYLMALLPAQGMYIVGAEGRNGYSVSYAGDVNGDGVGDVILGALSANNGAGMSYVIYGNHFYSYHYITSINIQNLGTNGFFIEGKEATLSGISVSGAGNMTGGACDDIIIADGTGMSYIIYGSHSGFVTSSPTALPTQSSPALNDDDDLWVAPDGIGFHAVYSVGTFILSIAASYFFRKKIAFHILDNWGHKYKFMFDGQNTPLEEGDIGIRLDRLDNDVVICVVKGNSYKLHTDDNDAGVSQGLYDKLKRVLENPDISNSYTLRPHEQNQLRNFLFYHNYIKSRKICYYLNTYPELGYLKGAIYGMTLSGFEEYHKIASRKQVSALKGPQTSTQDLNKLSVVFNGNDETLPLLLPEQKETD